MDCTTRIRALSTAVAFLLLVPITTPWLAAQESKPSNPDGELTLYPFMTEIGVVARREFRDESDRLIREVYYRPRIVPATTTRPALVDASAMRGPFDPNSLLIHSSTTFDYDEEGRAIRSSAYGPDGVLSEFRVYRHHAAGWLRAELVFTNDGYRRYEIRYDPPRLDMYPGSDLPIHIRRGPSVTHLYYDDRGERLISVRGRFPEDVPWTWGWGAERGGLCCAVALNRQSGSLEELRIAVTVRKVGVRQRMIACGLGSYRPVLRDLDGDEVPIPPQSRGAKTLQGPANPGGYDARRGDAYALHTFDLTWWYPQLPEGRYSVYVEYRSAGEEWTHVSNTVEFTVKPAHR